MRPPEAWPTAAGYDSFAPYYHLIYPDWGASVVRQGEALDAIIRETWTDGGEHTPLTVLDAACGIGTQSLGLAARGYRHRLRPLACRSGAGASRGRRARGRGRLLGSGYA